MHGMGDERGVWKQHREEVAREIRARRRPVGQGGTRGAPGRRGAFWGELGLGAARLVGVFRVSPATRKRKGVT